MAVAAIDDPLTDALCRRMDEAAWLEPGSGRGTDPAVEACRTCPALAACRDWTAWLIRRGAVPTAVVQAAVAWPPSQMPKGKALRLLASTADRSEPLPA